MAHQDIIQSITALVGDENVKLRSEIAELTKTNEEMQVHLAKQVSAMERWEETIGKRLRDAQEHNNALREGFKEMREKAEGVIQEYEEKCEKSHKEFKEAVAKECQKKVAQFMSEKKERWMEDRAEILKKIEVGSAQNKQLIEENKKLKEHVMVARNTMFRAVREVSKDDDDFNKKMNALAWEECCETDDFSAFNEASAERMRKAGKLRPRHQQRNTIQATQRSKKPKMGEKMGTTRIQRQEVFDRLHDNLCQSRTEHSVVEDIQGCEPPPRMVMGHRVSDTTEFNFVSAEPRVKTPVSPPTSPRDLNALD